MAGFKDRFDKLNTDSNILKNGLGKKIVPPVGKGVEKKTERFALSGLNDFSQQKKNKVTGDERFVKLPWHKFYPDPDQPRKSFDDESIASMGESLKGGQLQPIVVWPADEKGLHKISYGERRWRGAKYNSGDFELEAIIDYEAPARNILKHRILQVVENDSREDLSVLETALVIKSVLDTNELTQTDVAKLLGWVSKSGEPKIDKVSIFLGIANLPEEGLELLRQGIVNDFYTLNSLKKIYQLSPERFFAVCAFTKESGGITRKRATEEFEDVKRVLENKENESQNVRVGSEATSTIKDKDPVGAAGAGDGRSELGNGANITTPIVKTGMTTKTKVGGEAKEKPGIKNEQHVDVAKYLQSASHKISVFYESENLFGEIVLGEDTDDGKCIFHANDGKNTLVDLSELKMISIKKLIK